MRRAACLLAMCLAAAGCGAAGEDSQPPVVPLATGTPEAGSLVSEPEPTQAALDARPGRRMAARLGAGEVAVVDLTGRIGIRPRALAFAKGGRMEGVEWSTWSDRRAEGTGRMVGVICNPTCAQGTTITVPATITLTRPVACPRGRFFGRGEVDVASSDPDAESTSWLAAPC
jgi:hypothetical protein